MLLPRLTFTVAAVFATTLPLSSQEGPPGPPPALSIFNDEGWYDVDGPPAADELANYPELALEGNWTVRWQNHERLSSAVLWTTRGLQLSTECGTPGRYRNCRDPEAAWTGGAVMHTPNGIEALDYHIRNVTAGTFEIAYGDGTTSVLARTEGTGGGFAGTWTDMDGNSGAEIWRHAPEPEIRSVECRYETNAATGCSITLPEPLVANTMRGNAPTVTLDIRGTGLFGAGPLPVVLAGEEPGMEVESYCYIYEKPFTEGGEPGCASWGSPSPTYGEVVGLRVAINFFYGARSGDKTLRLHDQAVAFHVEIPEDSQPDEGAELRRIDVVTESPTYGLQPAESLAFDQEFRVMLVFTDDPGTEVESGTVWQELTGQEFAFEAQRTDNPLIYLSEPLVLESPRAGRLP